MNNESQPEGMWTRPRKLPKALTALLLAIIALALEWFLLQKLGEGSIAERLRLLHFSIALGLAILATSLIVSVLFIALFLPASVRARLFRPRLLARAAFVLACLVTLVFLAYAIENWRGRRAWNQYVRELANRGEPARLEELVPPPIPDEQNLAMAPLFKPVLDFEYRTVPGAYPDAPGTRQLVWRDTNGLQRLSRLSTDWLGTDFVRENAGAFTDEERDQIQTTSRLLNRHHITNGWMNLPLWQEHYRAITNLPGESAAADILAALAYTDESLAELGREAEKRPLARWPVTYDFEAPWSILLPHLSHEKQLCQLIQLRTAAQLALGRVDTAFAELELGFRIADSSRNEPFLISHLVRVACYEALLQPIREGIARHQFSEQQLAALQSRLPEVDMLDSYADVIRGERTTHGAWTELTDDTITLLIDDMSESFGSPIFQIALFSRLAPKGWVYQNQLTICRYIDTRVMPIIDPEGRRAYPERAREVDSDLPRGLFAFVLRVINESQWAFSQFERSAKRSAHCQSQIDQTVVACALERFRIAGGQYPERLDLLTPGFIASLPHDLVTGEALRYRRTNDGRFILYSLGWNETDEQGEIGLDATGSPDSMKGDWVWELPRLRER